MRSDAELMKGILERKAAYRAQRQLRRLAVGGAGLGALLVFALILAPDIRTGGSLARGPVSTLGATILGPEAGGYVIVALLAFAMGVVVTELGRRLRSTRAMNTTRDKEEQP